MGNHNYLSRLLATGRRTRTPALMKIVADSQAVNDDVVTGVVEGGCKKRVSRRGEEVKRREESEGGGLDHFFVY